MCQYLGKCHSQLNDLAVIITARNGTMITAENSKGETFTRNISFFRKVNLLFDSDLTKESCNGIGGV